MFSDATEKNEEGEDCISRSQFIQGCSVFVTENDQESQGEEDFDAEVVDSGDGSGEEYQEEEQVKSSSSRRSGRVTRMNPTPRGAAALVEQDQEGLESNQEISIVASDSEELSEVDDEDISVMSSSSKVTPSKSTPLKKSRSKKKDRNRILSRAEVEDAEDTFDLFFHEDSSQMFVESHDRTIGMEEMRYVSNLLGQKLTDEDVSLCVLLRSEYLLIDSIVAGDVGLCS